MKTLKQEGVPFGARVVFRLQHAWFLLMSIGLILSAPFVGMWALIHDSGLEFLDAVTDVLERRLDHMEKHRGRLIQLYAARPDEAKEPA